MVRKINVNLSIFYIRTHTQHPFFSYGSFNICFCCFGINAGVYAMYHFSNTQIRLKDFWPPVNTFFFWFGECGTAADILTWFQQFNAAATLSMKPKTGVLIILIPVALLTQQSHRQFLTEYIIMYIHISRTINYVHSF